MRARFTAIPQPAQAVETAEKPRTPKRDFSKHLQTAAKVVAGIAACVCLIFLGVFISRISAPDTKKDVIIPGQTTPSSLSDEEVKALVGKVKKHLVLPDDTPQIVAIANVDQLKVDQPFFRTAQNGDMLLVYQNRVILYRPMTDQVVDVAQIRLSPTPTGAVSPSSTNTPVPTKPAVFQTQTPTPPAGN